MKERVEVYQLVKIKKGSLSKENRRFKGTRAGKSAEPGERAEKIKHRVWGGVVGGEDIKTV